MPDRMTVVHVTHVTIPAWSTLGTGIGYVEAPEGRRYGVVFMGDHRPMRDLGEALEAGEEPTAEVPNWAITSTFVWSEEVN